MPDLKVSSKSGMDVKLSPFTGYEYGRLQQIQRFLVQVVERDIAPRAALVGYDAAEHALGWEAWRTAAGANIPFSEYLDEARQKLLFAGNTALQEHMRFIDQFENTWFPRAKNAIRRFVAPADRETTEAAFFQDLSQQPLGPGVFASVETFLTRLEGLKTSSVKGAKEAYAGLEKKGLSQVLLGQVRTILDEVQKRLETAQQQPDAVSDIAAIAAKRRQAYEQLNLWYIDWADTLRSVLSYHQQLRMGLITRKSGGQSTTEPEPTAEPEAEQPQASSGEVA